MILGQNVNEDFFPKPLGRVPQILCPVGQKHKSNRSLWEGMEKLLNLFNSEEDLPARHNACSNIVHPQHDALTVRTTDARAERGENLLEPWLILCREGGSFCISFNSYGGVGRKIQIYLPKFLAPKKSARKTDVAKVEKLFCEPKKWARKMDVSLC